VGSTVNSDNSIEEETQYTVRPKPVSVLRSENRDYATGLTGRGSNPSGARDFAVLQIVQTSTGAHPRPALGPTPDQHWGPPHTSTGAHPRPALHIAYCI